ncbi:MAG: polysaccharide deacetylase family protein [Pirellulales bacterium]|nr:polysaccharide deacetylase family protein [Pirellulales bacterium]
MSESPDITHAISFDIEDWFHIVEIKASEDPATWPSFESIVQKRTRQILDILSEANVRATFFILGWVAEKYPDSVRMIAERGHEIGTHSFWHRKVYELTPDVFRKDLARSIDAIQNACGAKVYGFRAPSFSITPGTEWAFDVIREVGLVYDASLFPARRAHGGYPCQLGPHLLQWGEGNTLPELPMSVMDLGRFRFCFSGGGYFRLLPLRLIERGIRRELKEDRPTVIYLHPRDFATDCPVMPMPLYRRFKCYIGQKTTASKLRKLLARHRFSTCYEVLRQRGWLPAVNPPEDVTKIDTANE